MSPNFRSGCDHLSGAVLGSLVAKGFACAPGEMMLRVQWFEVAFLLPDVAVSPWGYFMQKK